MPWQYLGQVASPMSTTTTVNSIIWQDHVTYNYEMPTKTFVNVSFDPAAAVAAPTSEVSVTALNATQQWAVRNICSYITSATGIQFNFTATGQNSNVDIFVGLGTGLPPLLASVDYYNYTYSLGSSTSAGTVNSLDIHDSILFNTNYTYNTWADIGPGTVGYSQLLRQMGHALGLKDPVSGTPTDSTMNSQQWTIMSTVGTGINYSEFRPLDIWALGWLYGYDGLLGNWGLTVDSSGTPVSRGAPTSSSKVSAFAADALDPSRQPFTLAQA